MTKTILITGATDGIGLEAAKMLAPKGHTLLLHGRNPAKLAAAAKTVMALTGAGPVETYVADLARIGDVETLAKEVAERHAHLDVLINNAGVFKIPDPVTEYGLDARFVVNTLSPSLLTRQLLPLMDASGRVINLSSAAQAPVDPEALVGRKRLSDMEAYAQSKLALTMWSRVMAQTLKGGPVFVAVNPGSLLASKMVKEGFGVAGNDIGIGADILARAALSDEFAEASGQYFDNDSGRFASPHPDALDAGKSERIVGLIDEVLQSISHEEKQ
ncbi:D-beta-hydroxybutyrate dehydrogenase [Defluviimonas aquaemixtae]|uniref:D-beta-hydroxybutyrate dehydrogenase n=1 Tax=Albidovulum aquaemixtae TaxID=1542388 RepID=A0A2R8B4M0_9RHOB|nr:SDR family NAD(P)-dependent oxidoreductase [Defluviimonas aquaemixtae]SPH17522.1 D-beta-hydroxybutyrate dehydrogenase [Defluviimonas aquaemixtae]